jgi:hypothetical protein
MISKPVDGSLNYRYIADIFKIKLEGLVWSGSVTHVPLKAIGYYWVLFVH